MAEYPFELQERGWGEFDMKIMLYFADKSPTPFVLDHDLNFQMQHYEVSHTLVSARPLTYEDHGRVLKDQLLIMTFNCFCLFLS